MNNEEPRPDTDGLLEDFIALAAEIILIQEEPELPARGSLAYLAGLQNVPVESDLSDTIVALRNVWDAYGYRGVLDLMTEWVLLINSQAHLPDRCRDMFGVVDLSTILALQYDEEKLVRFAAEQSAEKAREAGQPHHVAFKRAFELGEQTVLLAQSWRPAFRAAFQAADDVDLPTSQPGHNGLSGGFGAEGAAVVDRALAQARRQVYAALSRGPRRSEEKPLIQAALLLAAALMAVRSRYSTAPQEPAPRPARKAGKKRRR